MRKKLKLGVTVCSAIGYTVFLLGLLFFIVMNEDIFFNVYAMGVLLLLPMALLPIACVLFRSKKAAFSAKQDVDITKDARNKPEIYDKQDVDDKQDADAKRDVDANKVAIWAEKLEHKKQKIAIFILIALVAVSLLLIILFSFVIDYFQPIAMLNLPKILLIAGAVILLISCVLFLFLKKSKLSLLISLSLALVMLTGVVWANAQGYKSFSELSGEPLFLFQSDESGYASFRLPVLYVFDKDILNQKQGTNFDENVIAAFAEGRKNSSHDTGAIDLVCKLSSDGGKNWTPLKTLFSFGDTEGKYGNPTVILDFETGLINIAHMAGTKQNGYHYSTYNIRCKLKQDLTFEFEERIDISLDKTATGTGGTDGVRKDTLMVGPGKGAQIKSGTHSGRMLLPASNDGHSFVMYSDDNGATWTKGESAGEGNECEVAVLSNGELVMVKRENTPCASFHPKQFQRLSYSKDGGESWYIKAANTELRSPICMSSVDVASSGALLLSYPDNFFNRANLTVAISGDNGKSFEKHRLYDGASGYSCVAASYGKVYVLAEIGKVNYNEVLAFFVIDEASLSK